MTARRRSGLKISSKTHHRATARVPRPADAGQEAVRAMFDRIAPAYDRFNAWASLGLHHQWRKQLVARIPPSSRVLDLATGTGDVAFLARSRGHDVTAIDFSERMLAVAREKDPGHSIRWIAGSADRLPFSDHSFQCVTSAFALRNLRGCLDAAFQQSFRVLKAGGRVLHMDFGRPQGLARLGHRFHMRWGVPFIGQTVCGETWPKDYLERTIEEFFDPSEVERRLTMAGFRHVTHTPLLWGSVQIYEGEKA